MKSHIERSYLSELRRYMRCSYGTKRKIYKKLSLSVAEFLHENPKATTEDLYQQFGEPRNYADTYIELYARDKLCRRMPLTGKIAMIISVTAVVLSVITVIMYKQTEKTINDSKNLWPGYIVEIVQSD